MENISNHWSYFGNLREVPLIHIFKKTEPSDVTLRKVNRHFSKIFLDKEIWNNFALQIGCPILQNSPDTPYTQVKNFVIDLKKEIKELPEPLPKDIAEIVNNPSAPTFKQIRLLNDYYIARDRIVLWKELGNQIDPQFQIPKYETFDEMLKALDRFTDWCKENKSKLNQTALMLDNKKLISIPSEIQYLPRLELLSLINNRISKIPSEIQHLTKLGILSLSGNQISNIPSEIQHLSQLIAIFFHNNKISEIPSEIKYLTKLTLLSIDGNQISNIPSEISIALPKLEFYHL